MCCGFGDGGKVWEETFAGLRAVKIASTWNFFLRNFNSRKNYSSLTINYRNAVVVLKNTLEANSQISITEIWGLECTAQNQQIQINTPFKVRLLLLRPCPAIPSFSKRV